MLGTCASGSVCVMCCALHVSMRLHSVHMHAKLSHLLFDGSCDLDRLDALLTASQVRHKYQGLYFPISDECRNRGVDFTLCPARCPSTGWTRLDLCRDNPEADHRNNCPVEVDSTVHKGNLYL
jgi:hypothetical protein